MQIGAIQARAHEAAPPPSTLMLGQEHLQTLCARVQSLRQLISSDALLFFQLRLVPYADSVDLATDYFAAYRIYIIVCAVFCLLTTLCAILARCRAHASRIPQSREVLQAMLYVMTPTRSIWPQHCIAAAKRVACSGDRILRLSLRKMVDDVLSGRMELRAPQQDLPDLLRNALEVDGWTLGLHIERSWRLDLMGWVIAAQLAPSKSKVCPMIAYYTMRDLTM